MTPRQLKTMKMALSTLREVQSETFRLLRNGQRLYAEEKVWNTMIEIKETLAEHAMQEVQRLGQEIEQERTWVNLTDKDRNDCLVEADPCECLATPEAQELMRCVETKLKELNHGK